MGKGETACEHKNFRTIKTRWLYKEVTLDD